MDRDVESLLVLQAVERRRDVAHGLVDAVERRSEDRHHADRVLVAVRRRALRRQACAARADRDEPRLDVPVPAELLPADLDVGPHDEVRPVVREARRTPPLRPAALEGQPAEHRGLARAGRRAADRGPVVRAAPQAREHRHAAALQLGRLGVLVLVDHVLVQALRHERAGGGLHPGRHERREVQPGVAVEHQLVVDDLVGGVGRHLFPRKLQPRDLVQLAGLGELRPDVERARDRVSQVGGSPCVSRGGW